MGILPTSTTSSYKRIKMMKSETPNSHLRNLDRSPFDRPQTPALPTLKPPLVLCLSQIAPQPQYWLWPGRIPRGALTLLDAAPGCGASLLALTLAACISRGTPLPGSTARLDGLVLLIAPHDSPTRTLE